MLVATNWVNEGLRRELFRYGIKLIQIKDNILSIGDSFDLVYYARFTPPLIDPRLITRIQGVRKVV